MRNDYLLRRMRSRSFSKKWNWFNALINKQLLLTFPPILIIVFVVVMLVWMVSTCFRSTKGPASTAALLLQLQQLHAKFISAEKIDPEIEKKEMESLQNKIKTASDPAVISGNPDLRKMFWLNCQSIASVLNEEGLKDRTAWIKLNALMIDFNFLYFGR
jgi:hypothetical protein